MSASSSKLGPPRTHEYLNLHSGLYNQLKIASPETETLTTSQLNFSSPVVQGDGKWILLIEILLIYPKKKAENIERMGPSGETHFEASDFLGAFTNVISVPDFPDRMDPGCMFFLLAGICVRLDPYVSIYFSALHFHGCNQSLHIHGGTPSLHFHGGTPPMVTRDTTLEGWESRYIRVDYPQRITLEGDAQYPLGPAPDMAE